ncbi:MAG: ferritin-like domain-containing protein [Gemmatimonadaceae bacterium]|nr:ferritin-like domain-containing protein [Gemmatimonadaceae bacterium]
MENTAIINTLDPELLAPIISRRDAIAKGASASSKVVAALALGSVPIALGALAKDVYGQTPADVLDVLQFALTLEYLEAEFYTRGVAATGLIPGAAVAVFTQIRDHENTHVNTLRTVIGGKGATPVAKPAFDFTAKGALQGFNFGATQYATFQALAQAFEDTGVRAYKGQAGRLIGDKVVLTAALTIHSVEARHASQVRRMRGQKGWITGNSNGGLPAFTQPIYNGEENRTQAGLDITALGAGNGGNDGVTEAFDEPLTKDQVLAIVTPFLA